MSTSVSRWNEIRYARSCSFGTWTMMIVSDCHELQLFRRSVPSSRMFSGPFSVARPALDFRAPISVMLLRYVDHDDRVGLPRAPALPPVGAEQQDVQRPVQRGPTRVGLPRADLGHAPSVRGP